MDTGVCSFCFLKDSEMKFCVQTILANFPTFLKACHENNILVKLKTLEPGRYASTTMPLTLSAPYERPDSTDLSTFVHVKKSPAGEVFCMNTLIFGEDMSGIQEISISDPKTGVMSWFMADADIFEITDPEAEKRFAPYLMDFVDSTGEYHFNVRHRNAAYVINHFDKVIESIIEMDRNAVILISNRDIDAAGGRPIVVPIEALINRTQDKPGLELKIGDKVIGYDDNGNRRTRFYIQSIIQTDGGEPKWHFDDQLNFFILKHQDSK